MNERRAGMRKLSNTMEQQYDVIVAGAGPAGACAAIHLAQSGARMLLIEQKKFPREKLCGEFISPECLAHFARLGVLEEMTGAGGVAMSETIFYTGSGRSVAVPSEWFGGGDGNARDGSALGLSRAEMDARLLERARAAGVEVWEEASVTGLLVEGVRVRGVRVNVDGAMRECGAPVTVDATGRVRALVRHAERAGILNSKRGARKKIGRASLVAFKTHLENTRGANEVCEIYFYQGGYGGLSPVENNLSNLCFIARASDVRACGSDAERVMREVLMRRNSRAAETLRDARACSPWLSVALERFGRGELSPVDGLLAVGDAASFIDPFTGSGMLMALESGEVAAQAIARWLPRASRVNHENFAELARDYGVNYGEHFDARLRLCGWLRRAAFAPPAVAEAAVFALGLSARARRRLARATRSATPDTEEAASRRA